MKYCIIIPCFNEQESIRDTLKDIKKYAPGIDILIVNDGSTDGSFDIIKECKVKTLTHIKNIGIGGAVQSGFKYAKNHGYDFVIQIDGDGQHPANQIPVLVSKFISSNSDLIIGSRNLDKKSESTTFVRKIGTHSINFMINALFPMTFVTDATSGFRLINKNLLHYFSDHYPIDYPEPISIAMALAKGYKISEVGINMKKRQKGTSSIKLWHQPYYLLRVTAFMISCGIKKGR